MTIFTAKTRRLLAFVLCFAMLLPLAPQVGFGQHAAAANPDWMQEALDRLTGWGVMQGDAGGLRPNSSITRAEYVSMINRAYGYDTPGKTPFTDVPGSAWYADDIAIGYRAGYFSGTSANTASPGAPVTREQAMVILARNMRLQETAGEVTEFTDGRTFQSWSKGAVKSAVSLGLINGYPDGTFRPDRNVTRGEMARLLSTAVGTLYKTPGAYSPGPVYGNLTISSPGVTLRNTTISGDLYLTGGVDLGDVLLENVRVLGRIVSSGGGESNKGDSSVILRNVTAEHLVVDSLSGQFVTLRAEGDTTITRTNVLSGAYIEDRTPSGKGLLKIVLEGDKTKLDLAGNIEEVINQSPGSVLTVAQGTTNLLTMDERATDAKLNILSGAVVKKLNLDVATKVEGTGDVGNISVNAAGSSTTMLPDTIDIRPGITAKIEGTDMDTAQGQESSADPRLSAGYPRAADVAPTSFSAVFAGNKAGTVYWALTSITDGSVSEEDLITPPVYTTKILKNGNAKLSASGKEISVKVSGLTAGGSYYLSAVMVDARGWRSPVKVIAFSAPDDSVPNFATGYPVMSRVTNTDAQVAVMPTKSSKLYYALLPKGSVQPKPEDFKAAAVTGNLGFGTMDVIKNSTSVFDVNDRDLKELETYDLYLWLMDADGAKSSAVKKMSFTTVDKTPPNFSPAPMVSAVTANSIGFRFGVDENSTVYWVAVKEGDEYPKRQFGTEGEGGADLSSEHAKMQVYAGMNGLKAGKVTARANADTTFTVSGLEVQTSYDIYYIAVDTAGNFSTTIGKITANTQDTIPPTATQEFNRYAGNNTKAPFADTDVKIIFSEGVQRNSTTEPFLPLYKAVQDAGDADKPAAKEKLAAVLRSTMKLYNNTGGGTPLDPVKERTASTDTDWVIDYREATVQMVEGKLVVTFPAGKAINLSSGSTYYFQLEDIADTSSNKNLMGVTKLEPFTTISAQVALEAINVTTLENGGNTIDVDMAFSATPMSTDKVEDGIDWDMLLWSDQSVDFELYTRDKGTTTWEKIGNSLPLPVPGQGWQGLSKRWHFEGNNKDYESLKDLKTVKEYAIHFTKVNDVSEGTNGDGRKTWSQQVHFRISVIAGGATNLKNISPIVTEPNFKEALANGVTDIGTPETGKFVLRKLFSDSVPPNFAGLPNKRPEFAPGDSMVDIKLHLDRPGTVYYVVAPAGTIQTNHESGAVVDMDGKSQVDGVAIKVPEKGGTDDFLVSKPGYLQIVNPTGFTDASIKKGSASVGTSDTTIRVDGLMDETKYFVYFVLKGTGAAYSKVYLYQFDTTEVVRPIITLENAGSGVQITSDRDAVVDYLLVVYNLTTMANDLKSKAWFRTDTPQNIINEAYTALEAMYQKHPNGSSIFDQYATDSAKSRMAAIIRASNPDNTSMLHKSAVTLPRNGMLTATENLQSYMNKRGVQYAVLAVGKSTLGSGDAFSAFYPLTKPESDPPRIQNAVVNGSIQPLATWGNTFTGSATITFDGDLYYFNNNQTIPIQLAQTPASGFASITSVVTLPAKTQLPAPGYYSTGLQYTGAGPTSVVQINFVNALENTAITFTNKLSNGFGIPLEKPVTVTLRFQRDANGQPTGGVLEIPPEFKS